MSLRASLVFAVALYSLQAQAADPDLEGSDVGRWINEQGGPSLTQTLARNPRFTGETLRLVAMRDGRQVQESDELTRAVISRLSDFVLAQSNARLKWADARPVKGCAPPAVAPYLIGVEITAQGSGYRLTVRAVDVAEGVWVNGLNLEWRGRLNRSQASALKHKTPSVKGMETSLSASNPSTVAERLVNGFECSWPRGLDGKLFVYADGSASLGPILASLKRQLNLSSRVSLTPERGTAAWVMVLRLLDSQSSLVAASASTAGELALVLQEQGSEEHAQQVASVHVEGLPPAQVAMAENSAPQAKENRSSVVQTMPSGQRGMLGQLAVVRGANEGVCKKPRDPSGDCMEVSFDLNTTAYLLVFTTVDQVVRPLACYEKISKAKAGGRVYRMRVGPVATQSVDHETGFYVLAVRSEGVAHKLNRLLHDAPGGCATDRPMVSNVELVRTLQALLDQYQSEVEWRATHFVSSGGSIAQL